ncbi:MAG: hypothetical protein R2874_04175 [Desulfobacterales bacterium]
MKRLLFLSCVFISVVCVCAASAQSADFEDLILAPESFWDGSDESGGFSSNGVFFSNNYNAEWMSWDGFSYSNLTDTTVEGMRLNTMPLPAAEKIIVKFMRSVM